MTDKLTAAQLRDLAGVVLPTQAMVPFERREIHRLLLDEAARREAKAFRDYYTDEEDRTACRAAKDGDCVWAECPQTRDGEPAKSGRHCPLDNPEAARREAEADAPPPPAPDVAPEYVAQARACAEANGPKLAMQAHIINLTDAIEALRARVAALEGALRWAKGYVPRVRGAEIIDQALAAGGAEADERAKGGHHG